MWKNIERIQVSEGEEIKAGSQTCIVPLGNSNMVCTPAMAVAAHLGFTIFQMHHV